MAILKGRALLRNAPERYATTGLDWGNAAHFPHMAHNLQQAVTGILGQMQVCRDPARKKELREQLLRVDARLSVLERASRRKGIAVPLNGQDGMCRLALEKMADAFEEGALAWQEAVAVDGSWVLAGAMLEAAVSNAGSANREGRLDRFVRGPNAALGALAGLVVARQDLLEMKDLPRLAELVARAREVPVAEALEGERLAWDDFRGSLQELEYRLRASEARGG